jgi:hypothetical protein
MRPLGRHTRRWEDNIKIDLNGMREGRKNHVAQDMEQYQAHVYTIMNDGISQKTGSS